MLGYFRRRRETREWARETAAELVREYGKFARSIVVQRMVELARQKKDNRLEGLVKQEIDRLNGTGPRLDTATRYHEDQR